MDDGGSSDGGSGSGGGGGGGGGGGMTATGSEVYGAGGLDWRSRPLWEGSAAVVPHAPANHGSGARRGVRARRPTRGVAAVPTAWMLWLSLCARGPTDRDGVSCTLMGKQCCPSVRKGRSGMGGEKAEAAAPRAAERLPPLSRSPAIYRRRRRRWRARKTRVPSAETWAATPPTGNVAREGGCPRPYAAGVTGGPM